VTAAAREQGDKPPFALGRFLRRVNAFWPANLPKNRQIMRKNALRSLFDRSYGKFSANLFSYLVNFTVPLTLQRVNFTVFPSKNRNLRSEHSRGAPHH
jgi:hypothetical protein